MESDSMAGLPKQFNLPVGLITIISNRKRRIASRHFYTAARPQRNFYEKPVDVNYSHNVSYCMLRFKL